MGWFSIFRKRHLRLRAPRNIVIVYDDHLIEEMRRENAELSEKITELTNIIKEIHKELCDINKEDIAQSILI